VIPAGRWWLREREQMGRRGRGHFRLVCRILTGGSRVSRFRVRARF